MTSYKALTEQGLTVCCSGDTPLDAMHDAAARTGPDDFPVTLVSANEHGSWVVLEWGGKRGGLAAEYPPGETPDDARRLFGGGGDHAG